MSLFNNLVTSPTREDRRRDSGAPADLGPTVKPAYEIKETDEAFGLTVFLPGVAREGLELTAGTGEIRVVGRPAWQQPAGWTAVYRESAQVPYELVLTHENTIDADKIAAELKDGVLRASLPKAAAIKPRRISIS